MGEHPKDKESVSESDLAAEDPAAEEADFDEDMGDTPHTGGSSS